MLLRVGRLRAIVKYINIIKSEKKTVAYLCIVKVYSAPAALKENSDHNFWVRVLCLRLSWWCSYQR